MSIKKITDVNDFQNLLHKETNVIVKYSTSWCKPCQLIAPYYHECANKFNDKIVFVEVDADVSTEIAEMSHISGVPTFQAFQRSVKVYEFTGVYKDKLNIMISILID